MSHDDTHGVTSALFDLSNVSPLDISRASWLSNGPTATRSGGTKRGDTTFSFPFQVSPTSQVYDPTARARVRQSFGSGCGSGSDEGKIRVAVVKSVVSGARVVVPLVRRRLGEAPEEFEEFEEEDEKEKQVNDDDACILFRECVEAMDVESSRACASEAVARVDVDAAVTAATADSAFELALARALRAEEEKQKEVVSAPSNTLEAPLTPVEKQSLDRAVPKRVFNPKVVVSSPDKYAPIPQPSEVPKSSALDFEAKLEAALKAAESGGDLTAILAAPSHKTMNSPMGCKDAERRVNYRELGFTKAERSHHALHVRENADE